MGGRKILANANTLTGSIGVIGGKFNVRGLLKELGITVDSVEKGARSGYTTIARPFRKEESEAFKNQLTEFYEELFLKRVSDGRSQDIESIRKIAEGRVWTGKQAKEKGLVDRIGGISDAIVIAKEMAGLKDKKSRIIIYTPRRSLRDLLPFQLAGDLLTERIFAIAPFIWKIR